MPEPGWCELCRAAPSDVTTASLSLCSGCAAGVVRVQEGLADDALHPVRRDRVRRSGPDGAVVVLFAVYSVALVVAGMLLGVWACSP